MSQLEGVEGSQELILMGQVLGGVALHKKLPNCFGSLKSTKLQTNGWGGGVAEPLDYLMVLAIPILKALLEFVLNHVSILGRSWNRASNIAPKFVPIEEARHSLGPRDIVGALEDHSDDEAIDVASSSSALVVSRALTRRSKTLPCSYGLVLTPFFMRFLPSNMYR
ncbi:hypothetical protein Acr_08g0013470 [Actinidia rufa]|uniref:Uncharacterized protein n=1 Tax=Actinidia rufa TaxID=165716 RepID=A0A7J0F2L9_9ERIC|nr:hypothetical protein Acr_08g0013470 [Actinidia rufa]